MRVKDNSIYQLIEDTIKGFMVEKNYVPSRRELGRKLGMTHSRVCRYIQEMEQKGVIQSAGRTMITEETRTIPVPVLNSLSDPNHVFAKPNIKDFVFVSKKMLNEEGQLAILTIPDNSMINANIRKGSLLIVKRQKFAEYGQIILALCPDNKFYLRRYTYDEIIQKAVLKAESVQSYLSIESFEIRAVALKVIANV